MFSPRSLQMSGVAPSISSPLRVHPGSQIWRSSVWRALAGQARFYRGAMEWLAGKVASLGEEASQAGLPLRSLS
jgi:hypothetical protein